MTISFKDLLEHWLKKYTINGHRRADLSSAEFLKRVGTRDTIEFCQLIDRIGPEHFTDFVLQLCAPNNGGRPQSDYYVPLLDEFDEERAANPGMTDYALAARIARKKFEKTAEAGRPDSEKTLAETLVNRVKRRNAPPKPLSKKDEQATRELRQRIAARVNVLVDRTAKWRGVL